jgi:hypothetical protein
MATVNPWLKFRGLLPGPVRVIATVQSVDPALGRSTVQLRTGEQLSVLGTNVSPGNKCWIDGGQITGPAADLPYYELQVN